MSDEVATRLPIRPSPYEYALELLQRGVALVCLVEGIAYWVRLLGFFEGAAWRFDLMPFYWQAAAVPLAVLFPFAAVGLWMLASWGPVVWFLCAAAEIGMYGFFPELYGRHHLIIAFHAVVALCYAVLRLLLYIERRRAAD
ncbi:DUF6163 family protein [Chelativorans sp. AA-79]|uniref:DUF6163 family protein n=1 Tax=Chelativorans sp. AA-79 TaxID=3028735 RepID=UPI0023F9543F|nr:DUF6163 family protein [Chelativorans sp. AA-79]WEX07468.1 DUF6163 family protein [Chelativorans sp. AA-79]